MEWSGRRHAWTQLRSPREFGEFRQSRTSTPSSRRPFGRCVVSSARAPPPRTSRCRTRAGDFASRARRGPPRRIGPRPLVSPPCRVRRAAPDTRRPSSPPRVQRRRPSTRLERGASASSRSSRREPIQEHWRTLDAVVAQASISLGHLAERRGLRRSNEALRHVAGLARELIRAATPQEVVRISVRSWADRLGLPAAGWLVDDPGGARLVAARGLGIRQARGARAPAERRGVDRSESRLPRRRPSPTCPACTTWSDRRRPRDHRGRRRLRPVARADPVDPVPVDRRDRPPRRRCVGEAARRRPRSRARHDGARAREPMLAAKAQIDSILYEGALGADHRDRLQRSRKGSRPWSSSPRRCFDGRRRARPAAPTNGRGRAREAAGDVGEPGCRPAAGGPQVARDGGGAGGASAPSSRRG